MNESEVSPETTTDPAPAPEHEGDAPEVRAQEGLDGDAGEHDALVLANAKVELLEAELARLQKSHESQSDQLRSLQKSLRGLGVQGSVVVDPSAPPAEFDAQIERARAAHTALRRPGAR